MTSSDGSSRMTKDQVRWLRLRAVALSGVLGGRTSSPEATARTLPVSLD